MEPVLRIEGVSKQYRIYERAADRLKEMATLGRWKTHREFWALRDVSFEVEPVSLVPTVAANPPCYRSSRAHYNQHWELFGATAAPRRCLN
jgi:hypothetical protein